MNRSALFVLILVLCIAGWAAGVDKGLLYVPFSPEFSTQSATAPSALNHVLTEEVQYVVPEVTVNPAYDYVSWQWATQLGYNFCLGDYDNDALYYENPIWKKIDAIMKPRMQDGTPVELKNIRQLFISPATELISVLPAGAPFVNFLRPGDVGRILPGGQFELFLTEEHVRMAFQIPANEPVNIDAIAVFLDPNWQLQDQGIYLSLEEDHNITVDTGTYLAEDGAILCIPRNYFTMVISTYDGATFLVNTLNHAGCGQLILNEADVNPIICASGIHNYQGFGVQQVQDLDGLTLHNGPGSFTSQYTGTLVHHLIFSAKRLTGGGIVTTAGGGGIPTINGVVMGNDYAGPPPPAPRTTGVAVGLVPNNVDSLNGLAMVTEDRPHFVLDSLTPTMAGPGAIQVEIGGADLGGAAAPVTYLSWNIGVYGPGGVDTGMAVPMYGAFPEYFQPMVVNPMFLPIVPIDPNTGCGLWIQAIPPGVAGFLAGKTLTFQAISTVGMPPYYVSAPMKIQF